MVIFFGKAETDSEFKERATKLKKPKKRKKLKLKSEINRKALKKNLDKLVSAIVKIKAGGKCEFCGSRTRVLHAHHVFSRTHAGTRWDFNNLIVLCAGHHFHAHKDPEKFRDWMLSHRYNEKEYQLLKLRAYAVTKFTGSDLVLLEKDMQKKLEEVKP